MHMPAPRNVADSKPDHAFLPAETSPGFVAGAPASAPQIFFFRRPRSGCLDPSPPRLAEELESSTCAAIGSRAESTTPRVHCRAFL